MREQTADPDVARGARWVEMEMMLNYCQLDIFIHPEGIFLFAII